MTAPAAPNTPHPFLSRIASWPAWLGCALIALIVIAPIISLAWHALGADISHWAHLIRHVLPVTAQNTLWLLLGVGVVVTLIGTASAWLVTAYAFTGRGILVWALLLPLAIPSYVMAFAYLDLMHPIGPVQNLIRELLGYSSPREFRLPDIRSLPGAVLLLGLVLYPYVYLSTRFMFMSQAASLLEAARTLGCSAAGAFWRVALPMARPGIAIGLALALLETLNDIGASEFLGVRTMTVAVYNTWVTRSDLGAAAQLALFMLLIVIGLVWLERRARQRQRFAITQRMRPMQPKRLRGWRAGVAFALGSLPVLLGFVAPAAYLVSASIKRVEQAGHISAAMWTSLWQTVLLASCATLVALLLGLLLAWQSRLNIHGQRSRLALACTRLGSLGYAIPGTILAIGLLTPMALFDQSLSWILQQPSLWVMGSMAALILAYTLRFLAISIGGIEAGLTRIPPSLEQASRLLGQTSSGTLRRVHLPLLKPALAASALLVFVDAMKELPATLLLRPMNVETLATRLYAEAARGTYEEGAIAALAIVLAGLLPVILLARTRLDIGLDVDSNRHRNSAPATRAATVTTTATTAPPSPKPAQPS
ncbi:iron ABC transporter permease [Lampropedia puyangensis]|uniref:Iron ABC transporter permease n=1 Tax=Lampropedia puyangensis TaxID=1330072 RepID=A0A4S8F8Q5_9BURK|nr:iron ABC transporter permease [Lampropedia puyangensis]THU03988.1 iron ABC transporter permease [Lampropedia puyangensis]